ncbi:hypothetical protein [Burkholderia lata]|nr:hypothetical protein [Burkholderia lata]
MTVVDAINDMLRGAKDLSVWERLVGRARQDFPESRSGNNKRDRCA